MESKLGTTSDGPPREHPGSTRESQEGQRSPEGGPKGPKAIPKSAQRRPKAAQKAQLYKQTPDQPPKRPLCYIWHNVCYILYLFKLYFMDQAWIPYRRRCLFINQARIPSRRCCPLCIRPGSHLVDVALHVSGPDPIS